jgi:RNA polymerase subunit RPABC4/transcription elongation factor Spt4
MNWIVIDKAGERKACSRCGRTRVTFVGNSQTCDRCEAADFTEKEQALAEWRKRRKQA